MRFTVYRESGRPVSASFHEQQRLVRDMAAIIALTEKAVLPKLSSTTSRLLSSQVRY